MNFSQPLPSAEREDRAPAEAGRWPQGLSMWKCEICKEEIEDTFDACWNCGSSADGSAEQISEPKFGIPDELLCINVKNIDEAWCIVPTGFNLKEPSRIIKKGENLQLASLFNPKGSFLYACIATIIMAIIVQIFSVIRPIVLPGLLIWYIAIRIFRKRTILIELNKALEITFDEEKLEFTIKIDVEGNEYELSFQVPEKESTAIDAIKQMPSYKN
jgi:hypothetical protein